MTKPPKGSGHDELRSIHRMSISLGIRGRATGCMVLRLLTLTDACAWKQAGKGANRENARIVAEWVRKGRDIVTLHRDEPEAKRLFDQMYDDAEAAAKLAQMAKS